MSQDTSVFDLGNLDIAAASRPTETERPPGPTPVPTQVGERRRVRTVAAAVPAPAFDVCGSLSVFVPGSGQVLRGEVASGLFFLASVGLTGTLAWAILNTLDRLAATLDVLGYPAAVAAWALAALFTLTGALHLACVFHAGSDAARAPHPVFAGIASLVVPGWGQILNGDRIRAVGFLGLLWIVAAGWILVSPPTERLMSELGLYLPLWAKILSAPVVRWTFPAIVWTLSVYDAASRASHRR
ncbi:MAG: hypothetical protein ACYTGV_19420 [Planctomycetota bacterium]|jgi:hypothetical protein